MHACVSTLFYLGRLAHNLHFQGAIKTVVSVLFSVVGDLGVGRG